MPFAFYLIDYSLYLVFPFYFCGFSQATGTMYFPSATYRVQLNNSFPFSQLSTIIEYLHKLGISAIYASPVTSAMQGSTHGYDVCNPDTLNKEIGTMQELETIAQILSEKNMGWLQDIVPNHMAFLVTNDRIYDVMERGPKSPYYQYFDINWNHFDPVYNGKLMVPFIGKDLDEAIDNGEIQLLFDETGFHIAYFDNKYPVAAESIPFILSFTNDKNINDETSVLLSKADTDSQSWITSKKIWLKQVESGNETIQQSVLKINADKGLLRQLLNRQFYILTWYKVTEQEIDFRRFFTVNQLICLRMEDEFVFADYHRFIHQLYKKNLLQGLRIDHIDGLYHPQQYIARLRQLFGDECYIIAEKILEYNEDIARDWHLQGTSGYEFLSFTNRLLTDNEGAQKLLTFYKELVPQTVSYEDLVFDKKHSFLYAQMGGELDNLVHLAEELNIFPNADFDGNKLKKALGVLMASFPVYRIYPDNYPLHPDALKIVKTAFDKANEKADDAVAELGLLKTVFDADGAKPQDANRLLFLMRLMQFTGPLAAKGVEDTTFYIYNPLISHNEVGDSPSQLSITIEEFHQKMMSRQKNNPYSLNATSTHDTKRGEDGRMRINALAAMPDEWILAVNTWRQMNTPFVKLTDGKPAPTTNDEYFIYQSLIGAFPEDSQVTQTFKERTFSFVEKALREAKTETSYNEPNIAYEEACKNFIASVLDEQHSFLPHFLSFFEKVVDVATLYSLAQTVIKITAPGIPDIYQGCELWDVSYVDPDNRRPIDYDCRKNNLDEIIELEKQGADAVLRFIHQYKKEGREKLYATYKTLQLRSAQPDVFLEGNYMALETSHSQVMAYARKKDDSWIAVIVPFSEEIVKNEKNIAVFLPVNTPCKWKNIFTEEIIDANEKMQISAQLKKFPVAVLTSAM